MELEKGGRREGGKEYKLFELYMLIVLNMLKTGKSFLRNKKITCSLCLHL